MHGTGEDPPSFIDQVRALFTAVSERSAVEVLSLRAIRESWPDHGQAIPDPSPCNRPTKGKHACQRSGQHKIHVCRCGETWNLDGLSYAEWRAQEWRADV
jgi:hypothetical protein